MVIDHGTVGLAEGIIDDTCLVFDFLMNLAWLFKDRECLIVYLLLGNMMMIRPVRWMNHL